MKKYLFLLTAFLLGTAALCAQVKTRSYPVNNFSGIKAGGIFQIVLTRGNTPRVEVACPEEILPYVQVSVRDGVLDLSLEIPRNHRRNRNQDFSITAYVRTPAIDFISLSGVSSLSSSDKFQATVFRCETTGASCIKELEIDADRLKIHCSGASKSQVSGNYESIEGDCSGAAKLQMSGNAGDLSMTMSGAAGLNYVLNGSRTAYINLSGAANAKLKGCGELLKFDCSGASNLNTKEFLVKDVSGQASGASRAQVYGSRQLRIGASPSSSITYYGDGEVYITSQSNIRKGK